MKTSEILHKSADNIEAHGWTTGDWGSADDIDQPMCLEGGILAAMGMTFDDIQDANGPGSSIFRSCPAYQAVREHILTLEDGHHIRANDPNSDWEPPLFLWNDNSNRSEEEVVGMLRTVAFIEEVKEAADEVAGSETLVEA